MARRLPPLTLLSLLLLAGVARSTTVIPPTFDELVSQARTIFVAEVVGQRAVWEVTPQGRAIVTIVTFRVEDTWKGSASPVTQLEFLGGTIDDLTMDVIGVPKFVVGRRDVLFVGETAQVVSPLVGFMHGRLRVERDAATGVDRVRTYDGRSLASVADFGAARAAALVQVTPMRLSDLKASVIGRVVAAKAR